MKKRAVKASLAVLVTAIILATLTPARLLQEAVSHGQLLWRSDEAFVLIGIKRLGWHESYLQLAARLIKTARGGESLPTDFTHSIAVFRITPGGVERHVVYDRRAMAAFGVMDNRITDGRRRWNGNGFGPTTPDEQRQWSAPNTAFKFPNADGWSNRAFLPATTPPGGVTIAFDIAGQPAALKVVSTVLEWSAIDLERKNQPSEHLWSLEQRPRWFVSKSEYDTIFRH